MFAEYKGVRAGVIKSNGNIGTIVPDIAKKGFIKKTAVIIGDDGNIVCKLADGNKVADDVVDVAEAMGRVGTTMSKIKATNILEKSAEEMNTFWRIEGYTNSPYKSSTIVKEFQLAEKTNFVCVYDKIDSGMRGGWVMKAEEKQD